MLTPSADASLGALPPLISTRTRLLVLGSFPGVASLRARQYYGHPQNHFWPILGAIFAVSAHHAVFSSYQSRSEWLLQRNIGVWDIYAACEREGSLDSAIRNAVLNDFSTLQTRCPDLQAVVHNGAESFRHAQRVMDSLHAATSVTSAEVLWPRVNCERIQSHRLPSTSPANASWSFERKLAAWREVFERYGLV